MVFSDVVDGRIQGSNLVSYASLREMCRFVEDNINILPSRSPAGIELTTLQRLRRLNFISQGQSRSSIIWNAFSGFLGIRMHYYIFGFCVCLMTFWQQKNMIFLKTEDSHYCFS